jgi:hypothetical protein
MLAEVSAAQSLFNIVFVGVVSFLLIAMGLRSLFAARRGRRLRSSAWTWLTPGVVGLVAATYTALFELQFDQRGTSIVFLLGVALALLIAAFFLLVFGWRGRRVGDHPFCRKCGFDLFGRPDGTLVCGECGASLDAKRAIVIGERKRRPFLISAGLVLAILTLAVGANSTRSAWPSISQWANDSLYAMKSDASLIAEMQKNSRAAQEEFFRRWQKGTLKSGSIGLFLADELAATRKPAWRIGGIVSAIREQWAQGQVSEELTRRAMKAAMDLQFEAAQSAAPRECVRYLIRTVDMSLCQRMQRSYRQTYEAAITNRKVRINGTIIDDRKIDADLFGVPQFALVLDCAGTRIDAAGLPLVVGEQASIEVSFTLTLTVRAPGRPVLVETRDYAFADKVKIVDAKQMYCTQAMVAVPNPEDPSGPTILVPELELDTSSANLSITAKGDRSTLSLYGLRTPVAADLFMSHGGRETHLGQVVSSDTLDTELELEFAPPFDAEFILRPNNSIGVKLFAPLQTHQGEIKIAAEQVQRRSIDD